MIERSLADARVTLVTAAAPGAVAIVQVTGPGAIDLLRQATGVGDWPIGRIRLADLAGVDHGMAVALPDDDYQLPAAQLMPHGGPRVVQKLIDRLIELGATYDPDPPARQLYPEAASDLEADALAAIARAASPAAVDLLAAQPRLWREEAKAIKQQSNKAVDQSGGRRREDCLLSCSTAQLLSRSATLDMLIYPPTVVVIGRPNVGKSTLTNRVLGRSASVVADLPGTTRDWVAGLAELVPSLTCGASHSGPTSGGMAVRWLDTPGLRDSDDTVERRAIALARRVIADADVLIAMRDPQLDWPGDADLPRPPDLWVLNKMDDPAAISQDGGRSPRTPLPISARHDRGIDRLQRLILERLELPDLSRDTLWAFSPTLKDAVKRADAAMLRDYVGP
jgi:tRNA modification GTPase